MDDSLELNVMGESFRANRFNTTLFTFFGELALYNHVFLEMSQQDEETVTGAYVFCDNNVYEALARHIVSNDFPMVLNRTDVPACDQDAWARSHIDDLSGSDSFPEEWTQE